MSHLSTFQHAYSRSLLHQKMLFYRKLFQSPTDCNNNPSWIMHRYARPIITYGFTAHINVIIIYVCTFLIRFSSLHLQVRYTIRRWRYTKVCSIFSVLLCNAQSQTNLSLSIIHGLIACSYSSINTLSVLTLNQNDIRIKLKKMKIKMEKYWNLFKRF